DPREPVQRAVQRAGPELDTGQLLDVLDQRVAVLGSVGQADQDQHRRLADPAQHVLLGQAVRSAHRQLPPNTSTNISVNVVAATGRRTVRTMRWTGRPGGAYR